MSNAAQQRVKIYGGTVINTSDVVGWATRGDTTPDTVYSHDEFASDPTFRTWTTLEAARGESGSVFALYDAGEGPQWWPVAGQSGPIRYKRVQRF